MMTELFSFTQVTVKPMRMPKMRLWEFPPVKYTIITPERKMISFRANREMSGSVFGDKISRMAGDTFSESELSDWGKSLPDSWASRPGPLASPVIVTTIAYVRQYDLKSVDIITESCNHIKVRADGRAFIKGDRVVFDMKNVYWMGEKIFREDFR